MLGVKPVHFSNILMAGQEVDIFSCSEEERETDENGLQRSDGDDTGDEVVSSNFIQFKVCFHVACTSIKQN